MRDRIKDALAVILRRKTRDRRTVSCRLCNLIFHRRGHPISSVARRDGRSLEAYIATPLSSQRREVRQYPGQTLRARTRRNHSLHFISQLAGSRGTEQVAAKALWVGEGV